jgi:uncharacterized protein YegJ (DUF2314 family)
MQSPPIGASHILGRLAAFGLGICFCATTFAVDFETAKKEAGRLNETKEGAAYMDKCQDVLHKYISSGMDACGDKYPDTKAPALIALIVAADGHVTQRMSSPGIVYGECVMSHFPADLSLPRPPRDGWPVVVGVENRHHEVAAKKAAGGGSSPKEILAGYDDAIAPYVAKGRATYPAAKKRFLAGLPAGNKFLVRVRLRQGNKVEESFVEVRSIRNGTISGNIDSIDILTNYRKGQGMTIPESEIKDWVIQYPNGSEEGNVVGKFLNQNRR